MSLSIAFVDVLLYVLVSLSPLNLSHIQFSCLVVVGLCSEPHLS